MDCSMPGFSVPHCFLEFAHTRVHWVGDAIQPSHPLSPPSPPALNLSQWGSFPVSWLFASDSQSIGASASAAILSVYIRGWFPLGLTGLISLLFKELSRVFSNTTVQKYQFFLALSLLYGSTLTCIHDYWKNHSFDYMDLCWQSDVSAFKYTVQVCHSFSFSIAFSFLFKIPFVNLQVRKLLSNLKVLHLISDRARISIFLIIPMSLLLTAMPCCSLEERKA